jgi:hypothetical protein
VLAQVAAGEKVATYCERILQCDDGVRPACLQVTAAAAAAAAKAAGEKVAAYCE